MSSSRTTPPPMTFSSPSSSSAASDEEATSSASSTSGETAVTDDAPASPSLKRKRADSVAADSPDWAADPDADATSLSTALHVLATEAAALAHLSAFYAATPSAQHALLRTVDLIARAHARGGTVVLCGVGKSGLVARKTAATLCSLGLPARFVHGCDAAHGDLGAVRAARGDVLLLVSFSGTTPELAGLLPHVPAAVPVVALTAHADARRCPLTRGRAAAVLLPSPVHEREETSFGVSAPTTSTTVAIALGDMLAIAAAERVHGRDTARVFARNHPGGAIGAAVAAELAAKIAAPSQSVVEGESVAERGSPTAVEAPRNAKRARTEGR
jgi:D-arabinose 5-phosphate isomerase GutQ